MRASVVFGRQTSNVAWELEHKLQQSICNNIMSYTFRTARQGFAWISHFSCHAAQPGTVVGRWMRIVTDMECSRFPRYVRVRQFTWHRPSHVLEHTGWVWMKYIGQITKHTRTHASTLSRTTRHAHAITCTCTRCQSRDKKSITGQRPGDTLK